MKRWKYIQPEGFNSFEAPESSLPYEGSNFAVVNLIPQSTTFISPQLCAKYFCDNFIFTMGFSPVTGTAMDMSDALYGGPEEFGMHPAIQSVDRGLIRVEHKAKFKKVCLYCDPCSGVLNRKYFSVLENGYEANHPVGAILCCFTLPPNCCCPGVDYISKSVLAYSLHA